MMKLLSFRDDRSCTKCGSSDVRMSYYAECHQYEMCHPYAPRKTRDEHVACTCTRCSFTWYMHPKTEGSQP